MIHLFVIVFILAVSAGDQVPAEDAAGPVVQVYKLDQIHRDRHDNHDRHGHHQRDRYLEHDHHHHHAHHDGHHHHREPPINVHLKSVKDGHHGHGMSNIERIVSELHNPDYIEPIRVLDYRYLKTGGRDYTRSDGGQILILPKNVRINEKKEFANYDELLEFLRLKQIAEFEANRMELSKLGYDQRHNDYYQHRIEVGNHQQQHPHYQGGYQGHGYGQNYGHGSNLRHRQHMDLHKRGAETVEAEQSEDKVAEKSVEKSPQATA